MNIKRNLTRSPMVLWSLSMLGALLYGACTNVKLKEDEGSVQTILPGEIAQVKAFVLKSKIFNHELISNGTIEAAEKVDLRFEGADIVEEIYVKNGEQVKKGQKIARLAQFKLENALKQAADNLEKSSLELQDVLISQGYALKDSLKVPAETMKIAKIKSNYENSMIQYELARYHVDHSVLYAPYDGIVANLFAKKYNMPSGNEPFCTIIASQSLDAHFTVLESELPLIRKGDQVQLSPFSYQDYTVAAVIDEINPVVDENGMVKVKARIAGSSPRLYEGMHIKIRVQRSAGSQLIIPKEALVLRNNKKVVFTAKDHKAHWNYVETGLENSTGYVVTEGLKDGDSIIYDGNLNLAHETPIVISK